MNDVYLVNVLSALLTPTIAVLGSVIAYRQWLTARRKLMLDLFDRRFAIYDAARNLLAVVASKGTAEKDEVLRFVAGTRGARWLLSDSIAQYIDKGLLRSITELKALQLAAEKWAPGESDATNTARRTELVEWFHEQFEVLDNKCSPFLTLGH